MELFSINTDAKFLSFPAKKVISFLEKNDITKLEIGTLEIEGKSFFVNIFNNMTKPEHLPIIEAHRKYIDIHLMIEGEEEIRIADINNCQCSEYEPQRDFIEIKKMDYECKFFLRNMDKLAVLYPFDAHQTGIAVNDGMTIKKAVFKLDIDLI